jgi:hypothetical protein
MKYLHLIDICTQLFAGKLLTNQNWEYYKMKDNPKYLQLILSSQKVS